MFLYLSFLLPKKCPANLQSWSLGVEAVSLLRQKTMMVACGCGISQGGGGGKQFSHHSSSFKHTLLMIMIEGLRRSDAVPLSQMPRKSAPEWNQRTQNNWWLLVLLLMMTTMTTMMMVLRMLRMRNKSRDVQRERERETNVTMINHLWDPFGHFKHILFVCICIRTHSLT